MTTSPKVIPTMEDELRDCAAIFEELRRIIKRQKGYNVNDAALVKAYETAKKLHGETRRYSGQLYLRHPLAVATTLARLRCNESVLVAALLHDTMEDCGYTYEDIRSSFNYIVADIVEAVTAVKREEETLQGLTSEYQHQYLDMLTDAKLIKSHVQREALLVRMADREHNLSTLDACAPNKRRDKIEKTQAFLITAAKTLGIHYFEVTLSDYCMKYSDVMPAAIPLPDSEKQVVSPEYARVLGQKNEIVEVSGWHYGQFESALDQGIRQNSFFRYPAYNPFARLRGEGDSYQPEHQRTLRPFEIVKQLPENQLDFFRQDVYLNEIILVYKAAPDANPLAKFLCFHRDFLAEAGILFRISKQEKGAYDLKLVLTDQMENNYCLRLIPEKNLHLFFLGDPRPLASGTKGWPLDAARPKIPMLYAYSTYKPLRKCSAEVPVGATALDFAFIISTALALTVKGVQIKRYAGTDSVSFAEEDYEYPLGTVLHDGDVVHFIADYFPDKKRNVDNSKIEWFADITTETAKMALIDHFRTKLE